MSDTISPSPNLLFDDVFKTLKLPVSDSNDVMKSIKNAHPFVVNSFLSIKTPVKMQVRAQITFEKPESSETLTVWVSSAQTELLQEDDLNKVYNTIIDRFQESIDKAVLRGSGWSQGKVEELELRITKYNPIRGKSYIPLPKEISDKKAVLNIKNTDEKCFMWCVLAHLFSKKSKDHPERVSHYTEHVSKLNWTGLTYPITPEGIDKFEEQNPVTVNVYWWDPVEKLKPLKISPNAPTFDDTDLKHHVDLLLIGGGNQQHYTLIRNMSRLIGFTTKHDGAQFLCRRCLTRVGSLELADKHGKICKTMTDVQTRLIYPEPNSKAQFKNTSKQFKQPFIVYADFESLVVPYQGPQSFCNSYQTHMHEVCSFGYIVVRSDGVHGDPVIYRGPNASQRFLQEMNAIYQQCSLQLQNPAPMVLTQSDLDAFDNSTHCHICNKAFTHDVRVKDHDHITGLFRGAAHQKCNLEFGVKNFNLPIFIHNLRNYDSHLIMQAVTNTYKHITCIAETDEKYKTFTLNKLRFYDSFQHLSSSLETLAKNLPAYPITGKYFEDISLIRKGVYPYEYMDSWDVFDEIVLPPKDSFYSSLSKTHITDADYEHALKVWDATDCKTLGDYHDIYLKADVCLLADVFEKYRETSLNVYFLDPSHYISSPAMSWDAFLKMSDVKLDLISDPAMMTMIEGGIRGGISVASHNYCRANNKYLQTYDPDLKSNYIMYFDANNLYGWAMSEPLPVADFEMWVNARPLDLTNLTTILNHPKDNSKGYIVEVDLEYGHHLHDLHNDYPLAPERMKGTDGNLKLIPNLFNKTKYVCHYRNLQFYVRHGLRVTALHRVIRFTQKRVLADYISKNTELRKKAKSTFEKDFFKLLNNSCFGKTMENPYKRKDVRIVTSPNKAIKLTSKPQYIGYKEFHDSLYAITMKTLKVNLDKPVYMGMCVLDLSKLLMFEFYYDYFKPKYPDAKVLYTDTDSLLLDIPTDDIYKDMETELEHYDTSDYPTTHPLFNETNKKIIGKMKDEMNGKIIEEYVGLRSKQYSIKHESGDISKAKGIQKAALKNKVIRHEHYIQALNGEPVNPYPNTNIQSKKHIVNTVVTNKKTLCANDTKRVRVSKEFAYALGHYKL